MPFYVYVLKNEKSGILYTHQISDLKKRLARHNDKSRVANRFTNEHEGNWVILHSEKHDTRSEAVRQERFLKSGNGRRLMKEKVDI